MIRKEKIESTITSYIRACFKKFKFLNRLGATGSELDRGLIQGHVHG